jgi:hypothetical protein
VFIKVERTSLDPDWPCGVLRYHRDGEGWLLQEQRGNTTEETAASCKLYACEMLLAHMAQIQASAVEGEGWCW